MQKFSQRELLEEGFLDIVRGAGKAAMRGAIAATKGIAKTITPTGADIIGKAADAAGTALANIISSSPTVGLKTFLARPENRRLFRNYKLGKEVKLNNGDVSIEIKGEFIDPSTQNVTPITTSVIFQRVDTGGLGPEKWAPAGQFDSKTGQFTVKPKDSNRGRGNQVNQSRGRRRGRGNRNQATTPTNTPTPASTPTPAPNALN